MKQSSLITLFLTVTLSSTSLIAITPCDTPTTPQEKNLCPDLSRYTDAMNTLEAMISVNVPTLQKEQRTWSIQIQNKMNATPVDANNQPLENKIWKAFGQRLHTLSSQHADLLKTAFFEAMTDPAKNKETITTLFFFIASNENEETFPSPAYVVMMDSFEAISKDEYLFAHYTSFGANQGSWLPYRVNVSEKTITPLTWEACEKDKISQEHNTTGICGSFTYNAPTGHIVNFCNSGCVGTTGLETTYVISGNTLKVESARIKEVCDSKPFDQGAVPTCVSGKS